MSTLTLKLLNEVMNEIDKKEANEAAANNNLIQLAKNRFDCLKDVLHTILDRGDWRFFGPKYKKIPLHIIYVPTRDYGKPELKVCLCNKQNGNKELDNYFSHWCSWERFEEDDLVNDAKI